MGILTNLVSFMLAVELQTLQHGNDDVGGECIRDELFGRKEANNRSAEEGGLQAGVAVVPR